MQSTSTGAGQTCTTELTQSESGMLSNGWEFIAPDVAAHGNAHAGGRPSCAQSNGMCTWAGCGDATSMLIFGSDRSVVTLSKRFSGSGTATVNFGNCWTSPGVTMYLNGNVIAGPVPKQTVGIVKSFDFVDNDLLEIKDEGANSVTYITSIETCLNSGGGSGGGKAGGDPHLLNVKGERFNVNRQGLAPLINIASDGAAHLEVTALIEGFQHCGKKMFITQVNASGSWLEQNVVVQVGDALGDKAFRVTVDGQEVLSPASHGYQPPGMDSIVFSHADKFSISEMSAQATPANQPGMELKLAHGITMKTVRPLHRPTAPPHLNFEIVGLKTLPPFFKLGGLLGWDDHSHWNTPNEDCRVKFAHQAEIVGSTAFAN